jgi:hypothetical protein
MLVYNGNMSAQQIALAYIQYLPLEPSLVQCPFDFGHFAEFCSVRRQ